MRAPTPSELLAAWERCARRTPAERAFELLALASRELPAAERAGLPVGERDRRLLALRVRAFGPELEGVDSCRKCGETVEFVLHADDLGSEPPANDDPTFTLTSAGFELRSRLPTSGDLAAISREPDPASARRRLLELCVLESSRNGDAAPLESLPEAVSEALAARMAEADPHGNVELELECPACAHTWRAGLDVASFLWAELDAWTRRILDDVHVLASAYGWSETEILALGPRRQIYVELVGR